MYGTINEKHDNVINSLDIDANEISIRTEYARVITKMFIRQRLLLQSHLHFDFYTRMVVFLWRIARRSSLLAF